MSFSPTTIEAIGFYVYALTDENGRIFYIGKGVGNRVFNHVQEVQRLLDSGNFVALNENENDRGDEDEQLPKRHFIARMLGAGTQPGMYVIREGLTSDQALLVEAALISVLEWQDGLKNEVSGHGTAHFGLKSVEELEATKGEAFRISSLPDLGDRDEILAININRRWPEVVVGTSSLYDVARGAWKINKQRASRSPYAIIHANGIVRGIFRIVDWVGPDAVGRYSFVAEGGGPLIGDAFKNKNVSSLFPNEVRRSQMPTRYVPFPR